MSIMINQWFRRFPDEISQSEFRWNRLWNLWSLTIATVPNGKSDELPIVFRSIVWNSMCEGQVEPLQVHPFHFVGNCWAFTDFPSNKHSKGRWTIQWRSTPGLQKLQVWIISSATISKGRFTRRPAIYQATRRVLAERKLRSDEAMHIGQPRACDRHASPSAKAKLAFNSCDHAVRHTQKVNCQPGISWSIKGVCPFVF